MISHGLAGAALLLSLGAPGNALAQASACVVPRVIPLPDRFAPSDARPIRRAPIAAYTLALSWSPQHCREQRYSRDFQCAGGARFGFVLHGLWPDAKSGPWPQYCRPAARLPEAILRENFCSTPSVDLLQHEWARHGTCMTADPKAYFDKARALYAQFRYPDMDALSRRRDLTVGAFRAAFVAANRHIPGLTEAAVRVRITRAQWLDELWLCLDTDLRFARCQRGQSPGHASGYRMSIWRGERSK